MQLWERIVFAAFLAVSTGLFISKIWLNWRRVRSAASEKIATPLGTRLKNVLVNVLLQRKLFKSPLRGILHAFVFYGFLAYLLHTLSQIAGGLLGDYSLYFPLMLDSFVPGFSRIYDAALDIFSVLVILALAIFALRRWAAEARELDRPSLQSAVVLSLIFLLMAFSLVSEPARDMLAHREGEGIRPALVSILKATRIDPWNLFLFGWWGHILTIFAFMIYVPRSKHAHLIWAPVNFFFQKNSPKGALKYMDLENSAQFGSNLVSDFSWMDHLGGLSCIECGRCTLQCPANRTGKLLNPKEIMTSLKHSLEDSMDLVNHAKQDGKNPEEVHSLSQAKLIGNLISEEALWACTTCYACVENCPVGNNQVDAIVSMRRSLVLEEGKMPGELQSAMVNLENQANPWGAGAHKREEWANGLSIRTMREWKESGQQPDVLYWVGCAGAFDDNGQKTARAFSVILQEAGVSFGILGTEESCTGDSARRSGNEYLYQTLAASNIETLNTYGVTKIVATCPHCLNTLKNEYPQMGGQYEVIHHSDFIASLLKDKKIELNGESGQQVTYHDSCYLARYNDTVDSPRHVLKAAGMPLLEPMEHGKAAMCCGAGGAQMWKEEEKGDKRINVARTEQLLATEAQTIATACPFCRTMVSDGVKALDHEEIKTLDIAEITFQNMKRKKEVKS